MIKLPLNVDYTGKVVVVTGAGGLICGAMARAFAQSGAKVAALDLNEEAVKKLADELKAEGVTEEDFFTSKNSMYGSMIVDFENVEEVATNMASAFFKGRTAYTALETLSGITLEDVNNQLKNMFRKDKRTVFTVMPLEEKND